MMLAVSDGIGCDWGRVNDDMYDRGAIERRDADIAPSDCK